MVGISLKRSEYGALILVAESPFLIGLCLYPLLLEGGFVIPGIEGQSYLFLNGAPGWGPAVHILCYPLFAAVGYFIAINLSFKRPNIIGRILTRVASPATIWHFLVLFGLFIFGIFLLLVGPDVALINAAIARGGDFEGFGDSGKFLFLKTLASLSMYAACFIPYILVKQRDRLFILLYIVLTIVAYLNFISRSLILYQLILPLLVVMHVRGFGKKNVILLVGAVIPIALLTLFFGKQFGQFVSAFISGSEFIKLTAYQGEVGLWNSALRNFEFMWFSVCAGWLWFVQNGPTVPMDALMAFIGFIPSRVLESLGVGWLYHGNAEVRMACINSVQFGLDECTVPPLITGVSVYIAPIAGAIVAGFLRFFVYGRLERMWLYYKNADYSMTWVPYFLFMSFKGLYIRFLPTSIALASFAIVAVVFALRVRAIIGFLLPAMTRSSIDNKNVGI